MKTWLPGLVLLAVALGACRTYGGYGSEEETLQAMARAQQSFTEELARARTDLFALEGLAAENPALAPFAEQFRTITVAHQALLEEHGNLVTRATEHPGRYRDLNQTLGALTSEQRMIHDRYLHLLYDVERAMDTTATVFGGVLPEGRYVATPPYYARVMQMDRLPSVSTLTGRSRAGVVPAPQADTVQADTAQAAPAPAN